MLSAWELLYRRLQGRHCLCRCCSMTSGYEIHSLCFFNHLVCSEKPPFESQGKQRDFRPGSILRFSPPTTPPLHPLKLNAEGHSQRLFIEATLMCGLTADISNIKLWATSELCRKPPVSSDWFNPPPTVMEMYRLGAFTVAVTLCVHQRANFFI